MLTSRTDTDDRAAGPRRDHAAASTWAPGPAHVATRLLVLEFHGPRAPDLVRAEQHAFERRIWPAVHDLPGLVGLLRSRQPDGGVLVVVVLESDEAVGACVDRVVQAPLLEDEDERLVRGPDRTRVVHIGAAAVPGPVEAVPS
ncbi:hypothetical protein [Aquipuribacter nitratireducens]|uniref:Uncharacterized protein n=1 Tax=Aquipuribacter nitratireducens TaxID=650104 RepID=A0ABW0GK82_9MICO